MQCITELNIECFLDARVKRILRAGFLSPSFFLFHIFYLYISYLFMMWHFGRRPAQ